MTLENGQFTGEQARLPEFLEKRTVHDLTPGATGFIDADAFIVREDYLCWVDSLAEIKTDQEFGKEYLRVVCFDTGIVVDLASNYRKREGFFREDRGPLANEANRMTQYEYSDDNLIPVVGIVATETDLLKLDKAYKEMTGAHYLGKKARKLFKDVVRHPKNDQDVIAQKQITE